MKFYDLMNEACQKDGLEFNEDKYNKFMKYKELLIEWNEKINLTAIKDEEGIIKKHFIDCIKCFRFDKVKEAKNIIDIGTGAGFPGIPMAIMDDSKQILLMDSLAKRVTFLNEVIKSLNLKNVKAMHGRAEELSKEIEYRESYDIAISRAVANLKMLSELCIPYVKVNGYFVAMKGPSVDEEIEIAGSMIGNLGGVIKEVIQVEIEDTDLRHNMVVVKKEKETPKNFPRKWSAINKK
jgi:16S rRNA (guanine527-N7)-methyltransferase